jgi:hypothetical protein
MVGKCPGCGYSPKKTRDLEKHMETFLQLSRNNNPKNINVVNAVWQNRIQMCKGHVHGRWC